MAKGKPATVELVQNSDHPDVIATLARVGSATGVANIHRVLANSPAVFAAYINFVYALRKETLLPPIDRELGILVVLERHGGDYELPPHRRLATTLGLTDDQIANVRADGSDALFSDRQNSIRRFAERFGADPADRDALPADDLAAHLNSQEIVELALSLMLYMGMSHFTSVIEIPRGEDPTKFKVPQAGR